jgi:SHS2 domain-containing protein
MQEMAEGTKRHYEIIDTTADIGVRAFGKGLPGIFESVAMAMFDLTTDTSKVNCKRELNIELDANDIDRLLVDFLNQLLYYKDTENLVFASCNVHYVRVKGNGYTMHATVHGEEFDPRRFISGKDIKAATYHKLDINEKAGYAIVIFDI